MGKKLRHESRQMVLDQALKIQTEKKVKAFQSGYKIYCHQLADMHHTQNSLKKTKTQFLQETRTLYQKIGTKTSAQYE